MFKTIRLRRANRLLCDAVSKGDCEGVRKALRSGASANQSMTHQGNETRLLSVSLAQGDAQTLKALLDGGANFMPNDGTLGAQALSAPANNLTLLSHLLQAGLNPDADDGTLFFQSLTNFKEPDCILLISRLIAHGGQVNVENAEGETPLSLALCNEQTQLAATLVSSGACLPTNLETLTCSEEIKTLVKRNAEDLRVRRLLQGLD